MRDIIQCCKLPEAIEVRKHLGYNHDDIMVCEETSIAENIIIHFPHKNIVLNEKFNGKKTDIRFKDLNFIVNVDEGNHEVYDTDDEKEREDMFKRHNFKIIRCNPNDSGCNPNDSGFDMNRFLGKINSYVTKLRGKKSGK